GEVFSHPDVINAEVLLTEVTFFDAEHKTKAKAGRHLHLDSFVQLFPLLKNQHVVLIHVSRRTGIRRAKSFLRKRLGEEAMKRITILMDFEGAQEAGNVEDVGPPPPDTAE